MTTVASSVGGVDRIPPNNLEAEMAVLGSLLVDREMMPPVIEILQADDFYAHVHETIFMALVQLYERGEPLDKITLAEELKQRSLLEKVGGLPYLTSLMDMVPTAASAEYYAHIVREKSALRGLIHAGTQITRIGFENEEDVEGALDRSEQIVYEVGRRQKHGEFFPIYKLLKGAFEQIDRLYHSRGDRTGLTSGFRDIDEYTAGFQPGNFVILAARPAMGKTSMALTMAAAAAKEEQKPIAFFSLEMTNEELVTRLLCAEARINSQNLRRGNIRDPEWEKISSGMSALSQLPIFIDDSGSVTVTEIRSRCRRLQSADGLAAVFIDYLQLVRPSTTSRSQNRNDELSDICRTLKATAKDLQIPIVALAQLNRGVESRNDKRPMLSDLRDCLPGDSLVMNADTGERVAIADIVRHGLRFNVWALDDSLKLVRRPIVDAWTVGEKQVFRVTTKSGRTIRCTGGHRFRTVAGWKTLDDLSIGTALAVPRKYASPSLATESRMSVGQALLLGWILGDGHLGGSTAVTVSCPEDAYVVAELARKEFEIDPQIRPERAGTTALRVVLTTGRMCGAGKNPLTSWLRSLGVWKATGADKFIPAAMFKQDDRAIAAFLRGLFHADGSFSARLDSTRATVRLASISDGLIHGAATLLLRLGINAIVKSDERNIGGYRTSSTKIWSLSILQRKAVCDFMDLVGFVGAKHERALSKLVRAKENDAAQFDRIPIEVNATVRQLKSSANLSHAGMGWREQGKAMSRETCAMLAARLQDTRLEALAFSDVLWDPIAKIEPCETEATFDITVGDLHNFCVDDFVTHNSGAIEQEADMVTFLYRDAYYNPESAPEPDLTEFIIAKSRNGPTGTVKLRFLKEHTLFVPYGDSSHYAGP
jgi:replicative DNA helicase